MAACSLTAPTKARSCLRFRSGRTGMAPPITYEVDGKQYVAFMGGVGRPPAVVGPNDAKVDNPPLLFVFELDGKAPMPAPAPPPGRGGGPPPPPPPAELHKG